jgi:DNA modification methylase
MITLIQGDCFEQMPKLEAQSVDMVVTSPPYNRKRNDKYNNHTDIKRDYVAFLEKSIKDCLRVCKGNVFFNLQKNTYNKQDVHKIMGIFSDKIIEVLIWKKSNPMPNPHLINAYEYILVLSENNKSLKANKTYTLNHFTTPVYSGNPYKKIHRAVMHPDACAYMIDNFSKKGDTVLDPFMGVGTTGAVCKNRARNFIGIELDKTYFEICEAGLK